MFLGKLSEAETFYKWVLRGFESQYGHSHPETFSVLIKYTDLTYQIYKGNIMKNIKLSEVRTCLKMYLHFSILMYLHLPIIFDI